MAESYVTTAKIKGESLNDIRTKAETTNRGKKSIIEREKKINQISCCYVKGPEEKREKVALFFLLKNWITFVEGEKNKKTIK